ncbi:protein YgfX [Duganella qianjiadongensis]|uniref:Uncharacterized protein n=1 Tax=Duganella qianjiadongensis TaxID=2692176 RepID=A0ABW9VP79_9BURK|nr:protein YgfX [Duganella qianjiadongensis]MYM41376.1 hypothetical protein [Duganella qianjiadongensis]
MSIAAYVVLHPSPRLRWLCAGMRCAVCLSALFCQDQCWSLLCLTLAAAARPHTPAATWQLDISAGGQWRLSVYQYSAPQGSAGAASGLVRGETERALPACVAVRTADVPHAHYLLDGTLIWPWLLVLHLGAPGQAGRYLAVLPDSVTAADWRALMLACRALGASK